MPEKLTVEVPDELLQQFSRLNHYIKGQKGHEQTRRMLLDAAAVGIQVQLAREAEFCRENPDPFEGLIK